MAKDKDPPKDAEDGGDAPDSKAKPSGSAKKLILIVVGVLALVATSVGGTLLTTSLLSKDEAPVKKKSAKAKAEAKKPAKQDAEAEEKAADKEDEETAKAEEGADKEAKEGEEDGEDKEAKSKTAVYFDFEQPFVVNFQDELQMRYLQVGVSVMAHDATMAETVKRHMPVIRNNLVMLFSSQTRQSIATREGKEKIRADAQSEVQKILTDRTGKPVIEQLYFTSFVMQ
jgi:flagellar FliL protein